MGIERRDRKNDQRAVSPLLQRKAKIAGFVQCEEEKILGRTHYSLSIHKGNL